MKPFDIRSVFAIAALALLSACGGTTPESADPQPMSAPLMVNGNAPVADCEAEGCNRPRIIDGLAEQYRASAVAQQAQATDPVRAEPQAGVLPQAPASEAAPAVTVPPPASAAQ